MCLCVHVHGYNVLIHVLSFPQVMRQREALSSMDYLIYTNVTEAKQIDRTLLIILKMVLYILVSLCLNKCIYLST